MPPNGKNPPKEASHKELLKNLQGPGTDNDSYSDISLLPQTQADEGLCHVGDGPVREGLEVQQP